MPLAARWGIVDNLARHAEDAEDPGLPLMIWYGAEPLVASDLPRASKLAAECRIPLLRQYMARRMASGN